MTLPPGNLSFREKFVGGKISNALMSYIQVYETFKSITCNKCWLGNTKQSPQDPLSKCLLILVLLELLLLQALKSWQARYKFQFYHLLVLILSKLLNFFELHFSYLWNVVIYSWFGRIIWDNVSKLPIT